MFELQNLSVSYGEITALRNVTMTVESGETVALIGANGAGKTTLLRTISGLQEPSRGQMTYDGRDLTSLSRKDIAKTGIIHVPEGRQVFPDLTVQENLRLGTYARGERGSTTDIERVYEIFPRLEERQQQLGKQLSGGEQQMLAIGRALMGNPEFLLLDEPSLGLAPQIVQDVKETILDLNGEDITILLVEQNAHMALDVASRAYVLQDGVIEMSGDTEELRERDDLRKRYLGM